MQTIITQNTKMEFSWFCSQHPVCHSWDRSNEMDSNEESKDPSGQETCS